MIKELRMSVMTNEPALMKAMDRQAVLRKLHAVTEEKRAAKRISLSRLFLAFEENSLIKKATRMGVSEEILRRTTMPDTHDNPRMRAVTGFYADRAALKAMASRT